MSELVFITHITPNMASQLQKDVASLERSSIAVRFSKCTHLVKLCANAHVLLYGLRVHNHIVKCNYDGDVYMQNILIDMYGKCNSLHDARSVFDRIRSRNLFSWNIMISAYVQNRNGEDGVEVFKLMVTDGFEPDKVTFASVLGAASILESLTDGRMIHVAMVDGDIQLDDHLASALVNMYGKCGSCDDARSVFDKFGSKDAVIWNAMITGYTLNGQHMEALQLFGEMYRHNVMYRKVTFLSALSACSGTMDSIHGNLVHGIIIEHSFDVDLLVSTALVSMYSDCGKLGDAENVFSRMFEHDLVSWSAIIAVCVQHGEDKKAMSYFFQMHREGMKADRVLLVSIFSACANLAALQDGQILHSNAIECVVEKDLAVSNALVNMYSKIGCAADAQKVFDCMSLHNVISWTAMIEAHAYAGSAVFALELFCQMEEEGDVEPNDVTFVNVLSACSHAGLVDEGCYQFSSMVHFYGIEITMEHYSSMIDLFGRCGRLDKAEVILQRMPVKPNAVIWETLLSACRVHGDVDRGKKAAEHAILLDSHDTSPYVLLSNIYSAEGRREDAARIWKLMFERGLTSSQELQPNLLYLQEAI